MQGPNVKKLIVRKMSMLMVPKGAGLQDVMQSLTSPGNIGEAAKQATEWVESAIAAVKTAPDNPYGREDEAIAGEILRRLRP